MPDIALDRPAKHTVVCSFAGHLESAPESAFAGLAGALTTAYGSVVLVDESTRTVVVQGSWWYRGEYRVLPEETGTLVEHEIVNVAPRWHWAGPIAGRREIREAPGSFQALLTSIA